VVELTPAQTKERLVALGLVFFVVIFFWMAFQQSAVSMTFFARDYTVPHVDKVTNIWFDLMSLVPLFLSIVGLVFFCAQSLQKCRWARSGFVILAF